jgi:hypothetical protein
MVQILRIAIILVGVLTNIGSAIAQDQTPHQRMLLLPGKYSISPGGTGNINARCLDGFLRVPVHSDSFQYAPPGLGEVLVQFGGKQPISLQQAISTGMLAIKGTGSLSYLDLQNLSHLPVAVLVRRPTVLMKDETEPSSDLARIVEELDRSVMSRSEGSFNQVNIWRLRREFAVQEFGIPDQQSLLLGNTSEDVTYKDSSVRLAYYAARLGIVNVNRAANERVHLLVRVGGHFVDD